MSEVSLALLKSIRAEHNYTRREYTYIDQFTGKRELKNKKHFRYMTNRDSLWFDKNIIDDINETYIMGGDLFYVARVEGMGTDIENARFGIFLDMIDEGFVTMEENEYWAYFYLTEAGHSILSYFDL